MHTFIDNYLLSTLLALFFFFLYPTILVDPPDAPIEDRVVHHFRLERPLVAQMDYTFHGTVTWDLPVYPFKEVQLYYISLLVEVPDEETGFDRINVDNTVCSCH